jgi:DNA-binding MarR family transcriptional regulator
MDQKAKRSAKSPPPTEHDFWPIFVRFALSQKNWWIAVCAAVDLTPMQGHALRILDRPMAMRLLAESLACDASNVTGIVDKLETRGLIARHADDNDRRIKMLAVTEKGRVLREKLWARAMEEPAAVASLPAEARRKMAELLLAVIEEREGAAALAALRSSGE